MLKIQVSNKVLVVLFITLLFLPSIYAAQVEINPNMAETKVTAQMNSHVTYSPQFEPLILNSLYTQSCLKIAINMMGDDLCITPQGSQTSFMTDASGNALVSIETSALKSDSFFEVAIAYHSDGSSVEGRMPIWFDFLPTNNDSPTLEPSHMLAMLNNQPATIGTAQGHWLSAVGSGKYSIDGNQAMLLIVFEGLAPYTEYSLWCDTITVPSNQQMTEHPCNQFSQ